MTEQPANHHRENEINSIPVVMLYPNGCQDSDQDFCRLSSALQNAQFECILIDGNVALPPQALGQMTVQRIKSNANKQIEFSVVIPMFNEENSLLELYRRLTNVMTKLGNSYELIFVNDGSQDQSLEMLLNICNSDPCVHVVNLTRNFGHQHAISAGLDNANGHAVIIMDGDLQDPPEVIPQLIEKWREEYHVVYAIREKRKEGILKRSLYRLFYIILRSISRMDIPLDAGDFCLMDRRVVNVLNALPEKNRFVRGLRSWVGFRQIGVAYERDARFAGTSKYSFRKLVSLALDGLISFSYLPLRLATILGFTVAIGSFIAALYYLWVKMTVGLQPPGFATLTVLVLFLGGIQLITMGVIGEYIGHTLTEVKGRPTYIVDKVYERLDI